MTPPLLTSERELTRLYPFAFLRTWAKARAAIVWRGIGFPEPDKRSLQWAQPQRPITLAMIEAGFEAIYRSGGC